MDLTTLLISGLVPVILAGIAVVPTLRRLREDAALRREEAKEKRQSQNEILRVALSNERDKMWKEYQALYTIVKNDLEDCRQQLRGCEETQVKE